MLDISNMYQYTRAFHLEERRLENANQANYCFAYIYPSLYYLYCEFSVI